MTSAELKHRAKLQEWAARIQDCRSSGLSVRAWCRQEEINAATDYRWERNCWLWLKQSRARVCRPSGLQSFRHRNRVSRNVAERSATLHIGNASLDIYPGCDAEQLKTAGGASAPMLNDFTGADKVYIACGCTDLRKGIDGLARLVQQQFELDPFTNTLFLFCGRRRDRIKGLYWEKDGFILLYKRLEQGAYQWPRSESEVEVVQKSCLAVLRNRRSRWSWSS